MQTLTDVDNFQIKDLNSVLRNFSKNENVKFPELMQSIRIILSGSKVNLTVKFFSLRLVKRNYFRKDPGWLR